MNKRREIGFVRSGTKSEAWRVVEVDEGTPACHAWSRLMFDAREHVQAAEAKLAEAIASAVVEAQDELTERWKKLGNAPDHPGFRMVRSSLGVNPERAIVEFPEEVQIFIDSAFAAGIDFIERYGDDSTFRQRANARNAWTDVVSARAALEQIRKAVCFDIPF